MNIRNPHWPNPTTYVDIKSKSMLSTYIWTIRPLNSCLNPSYECILLNNTRHHLSLSCNQWWSSTALPTSPQRPPSYPRSTEELYYNRDSLSWPGFTVPLLLLLFRREGNHFQSTRFSYTDHDDDGAERDNKSCCVVLSVAWWKRVEYGKEVVVVASVVSAEPHRCGLLN